MGEREVRLTDVLQAVRKKRTEPEILRSGIWRSLSILETRIDQTGIADPTIGQLALHVAETCFRLRRWPYKVEQTGPSVPAGIVVCWRCRPKDRGEVWLLLQAQRLLLFMLRNDLAVEQQEYTGPVWWCHVRDYCEAAIRWLREAEHERDS